MKFSIGSKLWASFIAILLVLVAVGTISYLSTVRLMDAAQWVDQSQVGEAKLAHMQV